MWEKAIFPLRETPIWNQNPTTPSITDSNYPRHKHPIPSIQLKKKIIFSKFEKKNNLRVEKWTWSSEAILKAISSGSELWIHSDCFMAWEWETIRFLFSCIYIFFEVTVWCNAMKMGRSKQRMELWHVKGARGSWRWGKQRIRFLEVRGVHRKFGPESFR